MKISKQLLVGAVISAVAVSAQASYIYTETVATYTPTPSPYSPGQSGVTYFEFTFGTAGTSFPFLPNQDGNTGIWTSDTLPSPYTAGQYQSLTYTGGAFSSVSIDPTSSTLTTGNGVTYSEGVTYYEAVDWTISPGASTGIDSISFAFGALTPNGVGSTGGNVDTAVVESINLPVFRPVTVPEPAQTVAGAMLLGCGGLVFAGRRLLKKQTA